MLFVEGFGNSLHNNVLVRLEEAMHLQQLRKVKEFIELLPLESLVVKFESTDLQGENRRKPHKFISFLNLHLLAALLAKVQIAGIQFSRLEVAL